MVHGGAGLMPDDEERIARMRSGAGNAVEAGHAVLAAGGNALDAVEAAVVALEDDPEFNAGRGAALTENGASSSTRRSWRARRAAAGAVACVRGVRNPIRAARAMLEEGHHVMFVGAGGADSPPPPGSSSVRRLARHRPPARGASRRRRGWAARDRRRRRARRRRPARRRHLDRRHDGQRPGRVGDSPLIGAGTWADDESVAISCTGDGEAIIRAGWRTRSTRWCGSPA